MQVVRKAIYILVVLSVWLCSFTASANLLISPTRVFFDERERSQDLVLINTGDKTTTYRLEWVESKAGEDGKSIKLSEEEAKSFSTASSMLRFTPRQVTLQPGERQIVKVVVRRPSGLAEGDYRSSLLLQALPPAEPDADNEEMSIKVNIIVSYALPVIVRQGKTDVAVAVEQASLAFDTDSNKGDIKVSVARSGKHSAYVNVLAYWTPAGSNQELLIARTNSINLYHEVARRNLSLVWIGDDFTPGPGQLRIVIDGLSELRNKVLAEKKYNLNAIPAFTASP